jgi:dTDP-4-amino-4,6-dideoxygalactose transaminase
MISSQQVSTRELAILGGSPRFSHSIPVGQMNFPSWERYEKAMRGIFDRQWYTNHGPLAQEAELRLAEFLQVRNVVCVSNATVGLMMAVKALELDGGVIVPSFTFPATAQALVWANARPRFCDIERSHHHLSAATIAAVLDDDVQAILAVNLWGDACDIAGLRALADARRLTLFFDSAQAFGCAVADTPLGGFGNLEVFSFHATKVLNAAEGGCVSTDDDALAASLRNIRSSYGAGPPVPVPITANGRFSEAQAVLTLLSLEDYPANKERNRRLFDSYASGLAVVPGVRLRKPTVASDSNFQSAVCEIDEREFGLSRDALLAVLKAENVDARRYFYPGIHRSPPFSQEHAPSLPVTEQVCRKVLQLPVGSMVSEQDVEAIVDLIAMAHDAAATIRRELARPTS